MAFTKLRDARIYSHLQVIAQYGSASDNFDVIKDIENCDIAANLVNIFESNDDEIKNECLVWLRKHKLMRYYRELYPVKRFASTIKHTNNELDAGGLIY